MASIPIVDMRARARPAGGRLAAVGSAMRRHRNWIQAAQWLVVFFYLSLLVIPAFMPLPAEDAHLYDNLRLFAQFLFWGIWWPFVMLGTMLFGRVWCGVFCPEGALTELASRHGLGRPIPRWIRWSGWPLTAFICTTVYGQLISVYEYPQAALLILGGSTLAAVAVGYFYGRGKRVWCRYLCPANGVFSLLAKIAPFHFRVDRQAWQRDTARAPAVDCAPLIDIRHMKSASACHACGRCSDYKGAVSLAARTPASEILATANHEVKTEEALTLCLGVIGIATAAFQWSASARFIQMKTALADWLIARDAFFLLEDNAPWWLLTHYPAAHDVFTWLDGICILLFILGGGAALGAAVLGAVRLAAWLAGRPQLSWQRLALALVPIGGAGIFIGLSLLTVGHLKAERVSLTWLPAAHATLALGGAGFSAYLGWKTIVVKASARQLLAFAVLLLPIALLAAIWSA
ncbi:4Fe-4S binding protein [Janthinobacterium fluminis]|uniref:4Fe-4S binding protein n=1 Tax=Janthinobacterium fluminis TaxID=2987524 RepID=A0ABT5JVW6_9BURK|nr:4Fe-4S binding protein [Janthinobacterium fluminis]MDC8756636.1 4Fe-4S binding protein [Janthinobacterium fluminis]